ncbi:MAG: cobalamin B12-binding domain-containing protein [Bacteroidetes bacterium]|nr:cobalamin B12-binding domain-containing protein [Bacteroidota bacterium]
MIIQEQLRLFVESLRAGDRRRCFMLVREWEQQGLPNELLYNDILIPALVQFGDHWEKNEQGIVEEHVASQVVRQILAYKAVTMEPEATLGRTAMVGCVPDEHHDLASLFMANALEEAGWRVVHYGSSVPVHDIVQAVGHYKPDLLCLTMKSLSCLDATLQLLEQLRATHAGVKVMIGGISQPSMRSILAPHVDVFADSLTHGVQAAGDLA